MAFTNTKVIEAAVEAAIAKASAQIDKAQQQLIEEQRDFARRVIGQVSKLEDLLANAAEEIEQLRVRVTAIEKQSPSRQ